MSAGPPSVGRMRDRVTLQARAQSAGANGEAVLAWADVATVWAEVEQLAGRELVQARQVTEDVTHRVTIRYHAGLSASHRLAWGAVTLNVQGVTNPDGRRRFHELLCQQKV